MPNNSFLKLESINYAINDNQLIENISLDINQGDMISIIGPNGSGKSTLIKLMTGELKATLGNIFFKNKLIDHWDPLELAYYRSVLPQSNHLSFPFSVLDIIKMGRYPIKNNSIEKNEEICKEMIQIFGLNDHINQNYTTLSGGEKQRVQLARVFAQIWSKNDYKGKILFIDEPTSFLDINHQYALFDFLSDMNQKGLTIVMVLHDLNQAIANSNKIIMLKNAKLVACGETSNIVNTKKLEEVFDIKLNIINDEKNNTQLITY